jgi:hypothetical protein
MAAGAQALQDEMKCGVSGRKAMVPYLKVSPKPCRDKEKSMVARDSRRGRQYGGAAGLEGDPC